MTKKQTILTFCTHSLGYCNHQPTLADITSATGFKPITVRHWVTRLAARGEIETGRRGKWVIVVRRVRG